MGRPAKAEGIDAEVKTEVPVPKAASKPVKKYECILECFYNDQLYKPGNIIESLVAPPSHIFKAL